MIDIANATRPLYAPAFLEFARFVAGIVPGVPGGASTGSTGIIVHADDTISDADQATVRRMLAAYQSLALISDKDRIVADDVATATITCNDAAIAGDAQVDVTVYVALPDGRDSVDVATFATPVVGGVVELTLHRDEPGAYYIEVRRKQDDYATGLVKVEAI